MLISRTTLLPIEILLRIILDQYLTKSYCLTIVSEVPLEINFHNGFIYVNPNKIESLVSQLLDVSEKGCSDYIVQMTEPQTFIFAFEKINHLGNVRRSNRRIIFLPLLENPTNYNSSSLLDVLSMKETSFVANVLLILPNEKSTGDCKTYDLVTHKYVGPDAEVDKPLYLDQWNSCTEKFDNNLNLFPHDMSNLYGKTVKVACFTYKPYVLLDLDTNTEPLGRDGMEMRIIDEFCRWINCTVEIVRDDTHQWGEIYINQTGVGVIGNVVEDRADIGITALYSWYEMYVMLDFSSPYIRTAIICIAPAARLLASWELPLLPFSWYMWLAVVCTFFYASIAFIIARGCSTDRVFLTTFGMMVTQSQYDAGTSWRIRSVSGWLLLTGLVIDNAYGGGLAFTFTVPKYESPIDTVEDIVERKIEWGATHDAWIFSLTLSQEPLVKQLVNQFRVYKADVLKQKSFTRSMAFSIEKLPAGYFAIGEYITKEAVLDLELMLEDFYYEQCVAMCRKSSPYTAKISQFVGRLHESGLILAWETQVALKHLDNKVQLEVRLSRGRRDIDNKGPLSIRHVVGIFIIYITGVTISIILFISEALNKKRKEIVNNHLI